MASGATVSDSTARTYRGTRCDSGERNATGVRIAEQRGTGVVEVAGRGRERRRLDTHFDLVHAALASLALSTAEET
jgi:hypothetical protein